MPPGDTGQPQFGQRPSLVACLTLGAVAKTAGDGRGPVGAGGSGSSSRQLSVLENLRAAAQLRHPTGIVDTILGSPRLRRAKQAIDATAEQLLTLIGLAAAADRRAGDLPYGDQRRLELARALATGPRLLMLDEPAAGMDATETKALLDLILEIRRRFGVAVIVVEHDMDLIMNLCERIQVLAHGEVIFEGTPAAVRASPRVRDVYLGGG